MAGGGHGGGGGGGQAVIAASFANLGIANLGVASLGVAIAKFIGMLPEPDLRRPVAGTVPPSATAPTAAGPLGAELLPRG